jgi:hypothetical protein
MTNALAQNQITDLIRAGGVPAGIGPVAREIADRFSTSGRVAIKAATALDRNGLIITAHQARQARHGGTTYDAVLVAVNEAEDGEE